jgi:hypothetical protein
VFWTYFRCITDTALSCHSTAAASLVPNILIALQLLLVDNELSPGVSMIFLLESVCSCISTRLPRFKVIRIPGSFRNNGWSVVRV